MEIFPKVAIEIKNNLLNSQEKIRMQILKYYIGLID